MTLTIRSPQERRTREYYIQTRKYFVRFTEIFSIGRARRKPVENPTSGNPVSRSCWLREIPSTATNRYGGFRLRLLAVKYRSYTKTVSSASDGRNKIHEQNRNVILGHRSSCSYWKCWIYVYVKYWKFGTSPGVVRVWIKNSLWKIHSYV